MEIWKKYDKISSEDKGITQIVVLFLGSKKSFASKNEVKFSEIIALDEICYIEIFA